MGCFGSSGVSADVLSFRLLIPVTLLSPSFTGVFICNEKQSLGETNALQGAVIPNKRSEKIFVGLNSFLLHSLQLFITVFVKLEFLEMTLHVIKCKHNKQLAQLKYFSQSLPLNLKLKNRLRQRCRQKTAFLAGEVHHETPKKNQSLQFLMLLLC